MVPFCFRYHESFIAIQKTSLDNITLDEGKRGMAKNLQDRTLLSADILARENIRVALYFLKCLTRVFVGPMKDISLQMDNRGAFSQHDTVVWVFTSPNTDIAVP